jgi:hypothetical protein
VYWAPDERALMALVARTDRDVFRAARATATPLAGRKVRCDVGTEFE